MARPLNEWQKTIQSLGDYGGDETHLVIRNACKFLDINNRSKSKEDEQRVYDHVLEQLGGGEGEVVIVNGDIVPASDVSEKFAVSQPAASIELIPGSVAIAIDVESSVNQIVDFINIKGADAATAVIEKALGMVVLREKCDVNSGGSNFGQICKERLNISPPAASRWLKIGRYASFSTCGKALPHSVNALVALTELDEEELTEKIESGVVNPDMTANEAKSILPPGLGKPKSKPFSIEKAINQWDLLQERIVNLDDDEAFSILRKAILATLDDWARDYE